MALTPTYTCSRCKKEFDFEKIKYDDMKNLVCIDCLHKQRVTEKKKMELEKELKGKGEDKINLICVSCRFKFKISRGSQSNIKCPYCGKTQLMHVKKYKDEDDLIKESMDPRFNH